MRHPPILLLFATLYPLLAQEKPQYTFGTTVVSSSGLQGRIYYIKENTEKLPRLERMRAVGTIYTTSLNVWPQHFDQGFPGISERFEWFAIDYTGKFWIEKDGQYRFSLLSDDGARLTIDDKMIIDNDGTHRAEALSAGAVLTRGSHRIRVSYYQGPRFTVSLVLAIAAPGEPWRIFNTDDFKPPQDPDQLISGKIMDVQPATNKSGQ